MERTQIIEKIFNGIENVFDFYEEANIHRESLIKPEYLLTVKVAESLSKNNNSYIIKLEEPTEDFANSCVKLYADGFRDDHNSSRNGKIDIVVYSNETKSEYYPNKPLFPIEIKNINPRKYEFLLDIERNIDFLKLEDNNTGISIISEAYNVSIEEFNNITTEKINGKVGEIKTKYDLWLRGSNLFTDEIKYNIHTKNIDCITYGQNDKFDQSEGQSISDYTNDDYCRIGVIIEIFKKEK